MKILFLLAIVLVLISVVEPFCMGVLCGCMPMVSKFCCRMKRKCCIQYQAWLAPLIGTNDVVKEYIDAVAHEVFADEPIREVENEVDVTH